MVQGFLLDRLYYSFGIRNRIWRSECSPMRFDLPRYDLVDERLRILAVVVKHENLAGKLLFLSVLEECWCLLNHPSLIRFVGRRSHEDPSQLHMQENQHKYIHRFRGRSTLLWIPNGFATSGVSNLAILRSCQAPRRLPRGRECFHGASTKVFLGYKVPSWN